VRKSPEQVVEDGLSLVKATVQAMCVHPLLCSLSVEKSSVQLSFQIIAHPSDTRRIVGKKASTLRAIDTLTRLLFSGTPYMTKFLQVKFLQRNEDEKTAFVASDNWPHEAIKELASRISETIFGEDRMKVRLTSNDSRSTRIEIRVRGDFDPYVLQRFESAMLQIFEIIGRVHGRVLYVVVRHAGETANVRTV
jgi:predicted RNA-binding protein YlqC (UPF0109 family)